MVPPLMVRTELSPPNARTPLTITVPALSVKAAPLLGSLVVPAPILQVPLPFFVQMLLAPVVDLFCEFHVSVTPSATVTVLPPDLELSVPPFEIVVFASTVMFPTVVVAKLAVDAALKITSLLADHAVVKGPLVDEPQLAFVQEALAPLVFQ